MTHIVETYMFCNHTPLQPLQLGRGIPLSSDGSLSSALDGEVLACVDHLHWP